MGSVCLDGCRHGWNARLVIYRQCALVYNVSLAIITNDSDFNQRPRGTRFFHDIALIILTTSAIAYFAMASDLGATPIQTEFRAQGTRQIWVCHLDIW